jgi:hypothetical protein
LQLSPDFHALARPLGGQCECKHEPTGAGLLISYSHLI